MKTVLISGGSSGIGAAAVNKFLANGYYVINLDLQPASEQHVNLKTVLCDLACIEQLEQAMQQIISEYDSIDALVCNAGVHFSANILNSSLADFDRIININLKSNFFLTKAVLPLMLKQKAGAIVYVGSDQSVIAKKNSTIYGLTKAALANLAKSTALDFAKENIRANLVACGTIETSLYHRAIENYCKRTGAVVREVHQAEASEQPLGRIGQPEEVADLIYFLCSEQAQFITGAVVPIDGGYTAQ